MDSKFEKDGARNSISSVSGQQATKIKRNSSSLSLKSFNQSLMHILKLNRQHDNNNELDEESQEISLPPKPLQSCIKTPCLKIDNVDTNEMTILLSYPQSPQR